MKVICILNGHPVELTVNKKLRISELITKARKKSGNTGNESDWECRDSEGYLKDRGTTLEANNIVEGSRLYISPGIGVGG